MNPVIDAAEADREHLVLRWAVGKGGGADFSSSSLFTSVYGVVANDPKSS